jgi:hypothetical protein
LDTQARLQKTFSIASLEIESLTDMYEGALFRRSTLEKSDIHQALRTWQRLRLRLLLARAHVFLLRHRKKQTYDSLHREDRSLAAP